MAAITWRSEAPLDLTSSVARYHRWGTDPANVVVDGGFCRVGPDGSVYRACQLPGGQIELSTAGDPEVALSELTHRLSEQLPRGQLVELADRVPAVRAQLDEMPGYRPPMTTEPFESLVAAICAQQVNLTWATTTRGRLIERYGRRLEFEGITVWQFPKPESIAQANIRELRELQFTNAKSSYLIEVAKAGLEGVLDGLHELGPEAVLERVTAIRGIGRWSGEWLLARCLARPDAIAAGDLGVRKAVSRFVVDTDDVIPEADVRAVTADWGDGGNWATHLLLERLAAS